MNYSTITIQWCGANVVFTNVRCAVDYENGVMLLKVQAEVNPDNFAGIVENGIGFVMNGKDRYCMEFIPSQLIQAAK